MKKKFLILMLIAMFLFVGCSNERNDNSNSTNNNENDNINQENDDKEEIPIVDENIGKNKVDFYLFYSESCGHCHNEREWINSIKKDYPYVNFKLYEVSKEHELFTKVLNAFKIEEEYVPVTIIGNDYFVGYSETKNRKFIRYIEELSTKENCGVVDVIVNNDDVEECMEINNRD